jgi:SNF2 family DNA or RNA helicase
MNILMQLRKVCNHPDLFESRDYVTPSIQMFPIDVVIPHLALSMFDYDPLNSLSYKNLNLILEDNEKISKYDYLKMLKYFPVKPFYEVYQDIIDSK